MRFHHHQDQLPEPEPEVDPDDGESAPSITLVEPRDVTAYLPFDIDLDGNGIAEQLDLRVADSGEYNGCYHLIVYYADVDETGEGTIIADIGVETGTFIRRNAAVWIADLDADGCAELFISGDFASDNYITYALRYADGTLTPMQFDDMQLWNDESTTRKYTYGKIAAIADGQVQIRETFDILGSYAGTLYYTLVDGVYALENEQISFTENTYVLTTTREIPVVFLTQDSETQGVLPADTQLTIIGTDLSGRAYFRTADSRIGYIVLTMDDSGYAFHKIGEWDEFSCFAFLPYAG